MTYEFQQGDRIVFTERVHPKIKCGFRTDHATGRPIGTPEVPRQIVPQRGEGTVIGPVKDEKVNGRKVKTVKVHAGSPLGNIVVVADDAVLTAHPLTLDFEVAQTPQHGPSQYGTDAKGIA